MGFLSDGWQWLDANSKQIGALGSIVFGLSSAVVAWTALTISYRNSNGWKPILLQTEVAVGEDGACPFFSTEFEFWNRRKRAQPALFHVVFLQGQVRPEVHRHGVQRTPTQIRCGRICLAVGRGNKVRHQPPCANLLKLFDC
jgi:hypothetical protein